MRHKIRKREQFMRKALDGSLNWEYMVSRYVWDSEKTPYFTKPERLNVKQAQSEIKFFATIIGIASVVLMFMLATTGFEKAGPSQLGSIYCFIVFSAALTLGLLREPVAAMVCASFPVAGLLRILFYGPFSQKHGNVETIIIAVILVAIAVYSYRLIQVTRNLHNGDYDSMHSDPDDTQD